jgi:hypothetical protein
MTTLCCSKERSQFLVAVTCEPATCEPTYTSSMESTS